MIMISGIHSALSGLQAYSLATEVTANNIANMNTNGFKKDRVALSAQSPQGVSATVDKINTSGGYVTETTSRGEQMVELSNVDSGEEMPAMMLNQAAFNANIKSIQTADQMTQSLLDIVS
jgi:flagellar basal body rod protein FlgG